MKPWWMLFLFWFLCGCSAMQPAAFPVELKEAASKLVVSMADQAAWTNLVANVDGQVIDPGMEFGVGVMYVGYGKLRGVSGQVSVRGSGSGTGVVSPQARDAIVRDRTPNIEGAVEQKIREIPATPVP